MLVRGTSYLTSSSLAGRLLYSTPYEGKTEEDEVSAMEALLY